MRMSISRLVAAGVAFGLTSAVPALSRPPARPRPVTVTRLAYKGWPGCALLSNGLVEAIVAPRIGRILAFRFVGKPDSSPIFINPDWLGKTGADAGAGNWANFGGDKLWPSPQSDWPRYIGRTFPPDTAFDGEPERLDIVPGGVRLTTRLSAAFGIVSSRTITLRAGETRLHIAQTLRRTVRPQPTASAKPPAPDGRERLGIWSVTQTRGDGAIFLPLNPGSRLPQGFVTFDADSRPVLRPGSLPTGWARTPSMLTGRRDPANSTKLGTDDPAGWVASLYGGDVLFSEHHPAHPGRIYPDGGCRTEVYANAGAAAYVELEMLGPLQLLPPGRQTTYDITWQLDRLPRIPATGADAERMVRAALSKS